MSQRNYTCEIPTIPLLTIHMDNIHGVDSSKNGFGFTGSR